MDAAGFRKRCARRIQQGRVWVAIENGRLEFKADVVSETPEVVYLEGVYVSPEHRGNGYGSRCLTQLTNHLLERTKSVCVLVNETNSAAQNPISKPVIVFANTTTLCFLTRCTNHEPLPFIDTFPGHIMNTPRYFKPFLIAVVAAGTAALAFSATRLTAEQLTGASSCSWPRWRRSRRDSAFPSRT